MDIKLNFVIQFLTYFQILTLIIVWIKRNKLNTPILKWFVPFFLLTASVEFIAKYYGEYWNNGPNFIVYNIFHILFFSYLFLLYFKSLQFKPFKIIIIIFAIAYYLSIILELKSGKVDYLNKSQIAPYFVGSLGIMLAIILFLIEIIRSDNIIRIENNILFWISVAYFLYFLGIVPFKIEQSVFFEKRNAANLFLVRFIFTFLLNCVLITGFLWNGKKKVA